MLFLEMWFWLFALVAVPGFWLSPARLKVFWLLATSLVFHWHFAGPAGMAPIVVLGVVTYAAGLGLGRGSTSRRLAGICLLVTSGLLFYKYSELALQTLAIPATALDLGELASRMEAWRSPVAPLAISFFTFEFVHYLYEVGAKGRSPVRNPVHFAIFAVFFPTLVSGPIKRFPDFVPQLSALRNPRRDELALGVRRVIHGLFKKVCIADLLVEYIHVIEQATSLSAPLLALLAVLQGFRIYYDFAGYTDVAVGLALMLGIRVPENFDRPYFATSLRGFWRRWHMSLSTWIRDYIYVPLGGNRRRRAANLVLAMALCGLWHGAAWNFALWGLYHGAGLALEAWVRRVRPGLFEGGRALGLARWAVCYGFVSYGWLLFFYPLSTVVRMTGEALGG